jgi:hypothetical protein
MKIWWNIDTAKETDCLSSVIAHKFRIPFPVSYIMCWIFHTLIKEKILQVSKSLVCLWTVNIDSMFNFSWRV